MRCHPGGGGYRQEAVTTQSGEQKKRPEEEGEKCLDFHLLLRAEANIQDRRGSLSQQPARRVETGNVCSHANDMQNVSLGKCGLFSCQCICFMSLCPCVHACRCCFNAATSGAESLHNICR